MASTPFPLGAYLNNPDAYDGYNQSIFQTNYNSFVSLVGAAPQFTDTGAYYAYPITSWVGEADGEAYSSAASASAKTMTPVIGIPLASTASGSASPDQQFQAFASGQYDSVLQGIVKAWVAQGFSTQYFRVGWEMNIQNTPYFVGSDGQSQADWIKAFQHVYTVLHQAAAANGVNAQVVWNPGTTNYSSAGSTTNLYPGSNYVDVIGTDIYGDMAPYQDAGGTYHDWATGGEDSSLAQFIANPVNRAHYWSYPAANQYSNDGSGGRAFSLSNLIQFAEQQGKPLAISETGAGNSGNGSDVGDDPAFPAWLASQLSTAQSAGERIAFVNLWDANTGGNYQFSNASDNKPQEAAAWAQYFGAQGGTPPSPPPTSGSDTLVLGIAEDAYQGNALYTVSVDGQQVGGTLTATASHAAGQSQQVTFNGKWGSGTHTVAVDFLNDAYGGTPSTDRNLYVTGASYDGVTAANASRTLLSTGTQTLTVGGNATQSSAMLASAAPATQSAAVATLGTTYAPGSDGGTITTTGADTVNVGDGSVTIYADGPSVNVNGGAGALTFIGSSGADTITAGTGAVNISGNADSLTFTAGTGTAAITAGSGTEVYDIINGQAGNALTISDFAAGIDSIHLSNYDGTGISSQQVINGSTQITLLDHTTITLAGVTGLDTQSIFS